MSKREKIDFSNSDCVLKTVYIFQLYKAEIMSNILQYSINCSSTFQPDILHITL